MRNTFNIPEFTRNERNSHCDVLHIAPLESPTSSYDVIPQVSQNGVNNLKPYNIQRDIYMMSSDAANA